MSLDNNSITFGNNKNYYYNLNIYESDKRVYIHILKHRVISTFK